MPPENLFPSAAAIAEIQKEPGKLHFEYFDKYARFILENKLEEFAAEQLRLSREYNIPLLKAFAHLSEEQLIELGIMGAKQMLSAFAENKAIEFLLQSVQSWVSNQIPMISRNQVVTEDITLSGFIRRKAFRKFLSGYTSDMALCSQIMEELDAYILESDTIIFKILIEFQQGLYKQAQKLAKIGNWVWELPGNKLTWSDELYRIYELDPKSDEITFEKVALYNHPDDTEIVRKRMQESRETLRPYDFYYRIVLGGGRQKMLHARGKVEVDEKGVANKLFGTLQDVSERQNLITRLQESEKLFKQAQALTHIGNWRWDLATNKIEWSDELYRIYGLEPQSADLTFERFLLMVHPEDRELVSSNIKKSAEEQIPNDFFHRIVLADGTVKTLHAKGEVLVDISGKTTMMFGTGQDVTEQKETENALLEKQNFIQKIADITPSLIAAYNVHTGEYIFVNRAVETLLGYSVSDIYSNGIEFVMQLIHPDDLQPLLEKNAKALELANSGGANDEMIAEFQYRLKHKNGQYRWFNTYGTIFDRNADNKVEHVLNISVDVTERILIDKELKRKNEEIRRSEERYHNLIDEMQDYAILLLDKNGTIQNWNKGAEKIKGYHADEIIGKNFSIFYTENEKKTRLPEKNLNEAIKHGRASYEGWRMKKDGTQFWGSVVITALHDKNNNITGFSKITRDLTEKKLAEERMVQYAQRLEQKNQELERSYKELESFSYIASHDLQEPLRKIKTFAIRILEKEKLSEQTTDYFNRITGSVTHMQKLIDALLDYSRTSAPMLTREVTDLNPLVENVITNLKELIEEKNAIIETGRLPVIKAVSMQFQQVFSNIISNALKYSKEKVPPHIKISSEIVSARGILPTTKYKKCYRISIADNGIGFEQQYAEKIFELFQRLHGKGQYAGTGIGLAICKKIVQNHEGAIKATSQPGVGTTFNIYLPVEE